MHPLLQIELNEINFDYVEKYAAQGLLPNFRRFLDAHGFTETMSEREPQHLEPWIQWVTAHTGQTFAEHQVFRLGDIVGRGLPQIWERMEQQGYRVGAISPMNAECRVAEPAFFVPDPWTPTGIKASPAVERLYRAIAQAVNDNAEARITPRSALEIGLASLKRMRPSTAGRYGALILGSVRKPWFRAMYLDLLLADLFSDSVAATAPDFATLFLNAGAHIQHHYMFSSACYDGEFRNPAWYVDAADDPVLDCYTLYDDLLGQLQRRFPHARILLATGLHQEPYHELLFYWRLRDHAAFLRQIEVPFQSVEPRMSRDFLVRCADAAEAETAQVQLELALGDDGRRLFLVDNRGANLFVEMIYPDDIPEGAGFKVGNRAFTGLRDRVAFVAIKNGGHNGIGYFADSGARLTRADAFALTELPDRTEAMLKGRQQLRRAS